MLSSAQRAALSGADGEVRFDNLTRQLYATDASHYQLVPSAVAFPRTIAQASDLIRRAVEAGIEVTPRGAGTGLVGGALGEGLVIDFARHNRGIRDLNLETRTVRVGAGVVLDQLNTFLKPHGLGFGPDVATSSRATFGGMIANNSSGAYTPVYGTTADHLLDLEVVLADGQMAHTRSPTAGLARCQHRVAALVDKHRTEIEAQMPVGREKRWPGYALDRCLASPAQNLTPLLSGSEGTLAVIFSAVLSLIELPRQRSLGLAFFASVADALQATVELLPLRPVAIEHIDRILFDQTAGQLAFKAARDLLELDAKPCESLLLVEFFGEAGDQLAAFERLSLGLRRRVLTAPSEQNLVWAMRKAGLSLLTSRVGAAKPVTGIEDVAIPPARLPAYHAALEAILRRQGIEACYYGHAASGLLHVRPVLDLHRADGVQRFREIADEVSALVREFRGSLCAEHGVGIARTEYLEAHLGPALAGAMREIKDLFDPKHRLNPGKIVPDGRYRIDAHLRLSPDRPLRLPFDSRLAFAAKDLSFLGNLEQCNGCGGCLKPTATMCPTYLATGDESMSTRGRANLIRAALAGRGTEGHRLACRELDVALDACLSCKACLTECPSNVNLALLKADLQHARHQRFGLSVAARVFSAVDQLGALGCTAPALANAALQWNWVRRLMRRVLGIAPDRPLPAYATERFDRWFARRPIRSATPRGRVMLWDDTFVRYHEPHVGQAAVAVLEAAGFQVVLPRGRRCCGRPAFSQGNLDRAAALGKHNLNLLRGSDRDLPILFLEPSCWSMFAQDYRELGLEGASEVASRCYLFEQFLDQLLSREPDALRFRRPATHAFIHAHCHTKALTHSAHLLRLAQRLPDCSARLLDTACCGMAGAFGMLESKAELSRAVGALLTERLPAVAPHTAVVASGTSCRHQIQFLTQHRPQHMAEFLAAALIPPDRP